MLFLLSANHMKPTMCYTSYNTTFKRKIIKGIIKEFNRDFGHVFFLS